MKIILNAEYNGNAEKPVNGHQDYFLNILTNVGYPADAAPVADLLRKLHGLDGEWLVVSPVNWQATHNDSMLVAAGHDFSFSHEHTKDIFALFAGFVAEEGMHLHLHDAYTWLLQAPNKPKINARPVYSLLHRSLMPELEKIDDSLFWQKFLTASQMLFSDLNFKKENGPYPVNGVWVWGAGFLSDAHGHEVIALDEKSYEITQILSGSSEIYSHNKSYSKDTVFVATCAESVEKLPKKILSKIDYWYWNNQAYQTPPKGLLAKILRLK